MKGNSKGVPGKLRAKSTKVWTKIIDRFRSGDNVPGEWSSIIVAHSACIPVNNVSATKASSSTMCSTSASPNPSPNGPSCSKDSSSTSSMSSSSPNSANISSSTCTSKNAHLIITFVTLVVKDFPLLDFASLSPSVPLISSLPSHGTKWHCHRRRRSLQRRQAVPFRQESPVTPRLPLHPYGFRDKTLRKGKSSPSSKNFGKNLNTGNTPKRLDQCKEQLNAKLHAQTCCHATNDNKVKVPQTPSTVYGRFCHWRTWKG